MKEYNVQQISKLLQTNPETVRRWIRTGKLKAVQGSRKTGNIISEESLKKFSLDTPNYAGLAATIFSPAGVALPIAVGSFIGSIMSLVYRQSKKKVTSDIVEDYLIGEIERCEKSVAQKKKTIEQLQKEVQNDEKQIETYKYALTHLDLESLANEINNTLK